MAALRRACSATLTAVLLAAYGVVSGCSGPGPLRLGPPNPGTTEVVVADWNDIDPALEVSTGQCELALSGDAEVLGPVGEGVRWRGMHLMTTGDEPGRVEFVARTDKEPGPIEVTVQIGRDGDVERERRFLRSLRRRLEALAGRDWAPR